MRKQECRFSFWLLCGLFLILVPAIALSQEYFGGILGTVTDPSGGAIPGAAITIVNTESGASFRTTTNKYGYYTAAHLIPGVYSLTAEMKGFKKSTVPSITVQVSRTETINVTMQVGAVTQSVSVHAVAPLLDTTSGTVGTVVNHATTVELPLSDRNFTELLALVPGSVSTGSNFMAAGGSNYSISGNQGMQNNFTLDGVTDNESFFQQFAIQPIVDAIQEFTVQTNITSAEYGEAAGANIAVATKSGTNQFHGDAWEFLRNDALDANSWFNNFTSTPRGTYQRNQFGFTAGGPIYLPHIYNGKNKAWWFGAYEGLRWRIAQTNVGTVPTQAMLNGDFTGLAPIYNPYTTTQIGTTASGAPVYSRQPFPGNIIPSSMISPMMTDYTSIFYPKVTKPGANNYANVAPYSLNQYQYNIRADYNFSSKIRSFYRFTDQHAFQNSPTGATLEQGLLYNTFTNAEASVTWLVNPTTVLDVKSAFNRANIFTFDNNPGPGVAAFLQKYPIQGTPIVSLDAPMYPEFVAYGYSNPNQSGNPFITNTWQELANLTIVHGKQSIKAGFEFDHSNSYYDGIFTSQFGFNNLATADPQNVAATGNSFASYMLALPTDGLRNVGNTAAYMHQNTPAVYVQDDIRATRKLTADLGVRWEYDQWPFEKDNRLGNFDPVCLCYDWTGYNFVTLQPANAPSRSLMNPDYHSVAPRVGLAYALTPKTVIRSGFGVFYNADYMWMGQGARGQWPYAVSQTFSDTNTGFADRPLLTYMPSYIVPTLGTPPSEAHIVSRNNLVPYTMQWNFGIQRQLANNLMLEVDYVGNTGRDLPVFTNYNDPAPGPGVVGTAAHPRPLQNIAPTLGPVSLNVNVLNSNYNSVQVKLTKNFSNGLQFLASYAYAHALGICGSTGYDNSCSPQNPNNRYADYGNTAFDEPQILTLSGIYDLPVGSGRRFLSRGNRLVQDVLGGWELSGIFTANAGQPYNVSVPFDLANTAPRALNLRPNYVSGQTQSFTSPSPGTVGGFLNPNAFVLQAPYQFGNLGWDTAQSPAFFNLDAGLYKNFFFDSEKYKVQFRSEYFNLPNTHIFGCIDSGITDPAFGQASCTADGQRIIQFALKFFW